MPVSDRHFFRGQVSTVTISINSPCLCSQGIERCTHFVDRSHKPQRQLTAWPFLSSKYAASVVAGGSTLRQES
jgi:hypothetical protein